MTDLPIPSNLVEQLCAVCGSGHQHGRGRPARRRAMAALSKMTGPEASAALDRWTPEGMVLIPAGPFIMASTKYGNEGPVHLCKGGELSFYRS